MICRAGAAVAAQGLYPSINLIICESYRAKTTDGSNCPYHKPRFRLVNGNGEISQLQSAVLKADGFWAARSRGEGPFPDLPENRSTAGASAAGRAYAGSLQGRSFLYHLAQLGNLW